MRVINAVYTPRDPRVILADVKPLAAEYYRATGKPLGATGELAEFEAAEKLGLQLAEARTAGYDATKMIDGDEVTFQIKGRRPRKSDIYRGRVPSINLKKPFDYVLLVLLDENYDALEIWQADRAAVTARLEAPGSKARNERGSLAITQFKSIANKVWPECGY